MKIYSQEVKKDVGTLSNSLSGNLKRTENRLQFERSASVFVDSQLPDIKEAPNGT
jgi:hypothetical protein